VELLCQHLGHDRWDRLNLKGGHGDNARAVDKPIAGLLKDLKSRGLLDSTLVIWGGEFGRTPMAQGSDGRDHNPFGFTMWLAGSGIKGGTICGRRTTTAITRSRTRSRCVRHAAPASGPQEEHVPWRPRHAADGRAWRTIRGILA
jgi:hypothetical protein